MIDKYIFNPSAIVHSSNAEENIYIDCEGRQFIVSPNTYRFICKLTGKKAGKKADKQKQSVEIGINIDEDRIIEYLLSRHIIIDQNGNNIDRPKQINEVENHFIDYMARLSTKRKFIAPKYSRFIGDLFKPLYVSVVPYLIIVFFIGVAIYTLWFSVTQYNLIIEPSITLFTMSIYLPLFIVIDILMSPIHEFGHLGAARSQGVEVGEVGVGIYFLSFAFYTDLTAANTASKHSRIIIDLGGIVIQCFITTILSIIAIISNSVPLIAISISLINNVLYNLNPLLKTDGYWLLSDLLGIVNLHIKFEEYIKKAIKDKKLYFNTKYNKYLAIYAIAFVLFLAVIVVAAVILLPNYVSAYPNIFLEYIQNIKNAFATSQYGMLALNLYLLLLLFVPFIGTGILLYKLFKFYGGRNNDQ